MYSSEFWQRANIQSICEYIRNGRELDAIEPGTPEERHKQYNESLTRSIVICKDKMLTFDWNSINESQIETELDLMFDQVLRDTDKLKDLAFEMGFLSGMAMVNGIKSTTR